MHLITLKVRVVVGILVDLTININKKSGITGSAIGDILHGVKLSLD